MLDDETTLFDLAMLSPHSPITAAKNYNTKGTISSQAETTEAGEKKKEEEEELNMDEVFNLNETIAIHSAFSPNTAANLFNQHGIISPYEEEVNKNNGTLTKTAPNASDHHQQQQDEKKEEAGQFKNKRTKPIMKIDMGHPITVSSSKEIISDVDIAIHCPFSPRTAANFYNEYGLVTSLTTNSKDPNKIVEKTLEKRVEN